MENDEHSNIHIRTHTEEKPPRVALYVWMRSRRREKDNKLRAAHWCAHTQRQEKRALNYYLEPRLVSR